MVVGFKRIELFAPVSISSLSRGGFFIQLYSLGGSFWRVRYLEKRLFSV